MSHLRDVPGLAELISRHGIKEFVETGTGNGDGLRTAIELGLEIRFSCDLNWDSVANGNQWGNVAREDSLSFLTRMANRTYSPTLYFLDAHFGDKFGVKGCDPWPLPDELRILASKQGIGRDIVVCDDLHCVQDPENPTREDGPGHDWDAVEGTIAELVSQFLATHQVAIHAVSTGILILEPK